MAGVCNPFSQAPIQIVIDRDRIGRIRLALRRSEDTTCNPVVHDMHTDAVSRTHLTDSERPRRDGPGIRCLKRIQLIMLAVKDLPVELVRPSALSRTAISLSACRSASARILATNASG